MYKKYFLDDYDKVLEVIKLNREYIGEHNLSEFNELEVITWFLMNSHNTISSIASSCGTLSNSTYNKQSYIDNINETQERRCNDYIYEYIDTILTGYDLDSEEKLEAIREYIDKLVY